MGKELIERTPVAWLYVRNDELYRFVTLHRWPSSKLKSPFSDLAYIETPLYETETQGTADNERIAELEADVVKFRRRSTDRQYMIEALVNMLGPTALKVWQGWQERGVQRVHYDWGPGAASLTGEERAAMVLEMDEALHAGRFEQVEDIDAGLPEPRDVRDIVSEIQARAILEGKAS